jgi:hypothetical protein
VREVLQFEEVAGAIRLSGRFGPHLIISKVIAQAKIAKIEDCAPCKADPSAGPSSSLLVRNVS